MRKFLYIISLVSFLVSCNNHRSKVINRSIGKYELSPFLTTNELFELVKNESLTLYLFDDMTFIIRSNKKSCFSNVTGQWDVGVDFESEYYSFELKNCKTKASRALVIPVNCGKYKGQLGFK